MITYRSLVRLLIASLLSNVTASAQTGMSDGIVVAAPPGASKKGCDGPFVDMVSEGQLFRVVCCGENNGNETMQLEVTDVSTGAAIYSSDLHPPLPADEKAAFEDAVFSDGRIWIFLTTLDRTKGEGVFSVHAWPIDPATGASQGDLVRIGKVPFSASGTGIHDPMPLGLVVGVSPNGKHVALLLDELRIRGDGVMVAWVLSGEMVEEWTAAFAIKFSLPIAIYHPIRTIATLVTDNGAVYASLNTNVLMGEAESKRAVGTKLVRLTREGYSGVPGPFAEDRRLELGYASLSDDGMLVAGVGVDQNRPVQGHETLSGMILERRGSDLEERANSGWLPFPGPVLEGMTVDVDVHPRLDGGAFVVCNSYTCFSDQKGLVVASFGPDMHLEWMHCFPRNARGTVLVSGITEDGLEVLVTERAENMEAWRTHGRIERARSDHQPTVRIRFDRDGEPLFDVDERYTMTAFQLPHHPRDPVQICDCLVKENGKKEKRTCIVNFK